MEFTHDRPKGSRQRARLCASSPRAHDGEPGCHERSVAARPPRHLPGAALRRRQLPSRAIRCRSRELSRHRRHGGRPHRLRGSTPPAGWPHVGRQVRSSSTPPSRESSPRKHLCAAPASFRRSARDSLARSRRDGVAQHAAFRTCRVSGVRPIVRGGKGSPERQRTSNARSTSGRYHGQASDGWCHSGWCGVSARATVFVTIPMMTLLGKSTEPATLEGYGPIDPATARELVAGAPNLRRILTHPVTGAVLDVGRDTFAISSGLRTWLRLRDGTCRFPGCNTSAARSDVDHTVDRAFGGPTTPDNLAHLCPQHHKLKHNTAWRVHHHGNGHLQWTSPSGRVYSTEPAYSVASPQIIHAKS